MKIRLEQRATQTLVMTPKLQQAIQILLMSRMELSQRLSLELEENPILDLEEDSDDSVDLEDLADFDGMDEFRLATDEIPNESLEKMDLADEKTPDFDLEDVYPDFNLGNLADDALSQSERETWEHWDNEDKPREDIRQQYSLQDYLLLQLHMSLLSSVEYEIGEAIIGNINDNGYLTVSIEQIATEVQKDPSQVENVLEFIQNSFEPTGVGARTPQECLLIQLKAEGMEDSLAANIIRNHFEDFGNNRYPEIAKALSVSVDDIVETRELIRNTLSPFPGHAYGVSSPAHAKIPDVVIEKVDGEYKIITNDNGMPKLRFSRKYLAMLENPNGLPEETRSWLDNYKRRAIDLLKSVEQRRQTIVKVTESIFQVQKDFLEKGSKGLKPLALKNIAEMAGVHESTVSRVTTNKYVSTPQGVFELKEFFSGGMESDSGQMIATTRIKEMVKELIESEDRDKPLSDKNLEEILKSKGIPVARRTITKYRKELDIPSSNKRKKKW